MNDAADFLAFLGQAAPGEPRGNDELVRAIVPLIAQVIEHHDEGRVAPLEGVGRLHVANGSLWFHDADAQAPRIDLAAVRAREPQLRKRGVEVVDRVRVDIDARGARVQTEEVGGDGLPTHPVHLVGYRGWEHAIGHHDALTDVYSLGMLLASLATGGDFTRAEALRRFVEHRASILALNPKLHPVIAKAILRMTELDRRKRAADLIGLLERLKNYRHVDESVDQSLNFEAVDGFIQGDLNSRRRIILSQLKSRLFDLTRRNRMLWFRETQQSLDLTLASVPTTLDVASVTEDDLFTWEGAGGRALRAGKPTRLDRFIRFEETPYVRATLDGIRNQARRDTAEYGFSQLKIVIAFLNWHNLRDAKEERIRSPLLTLPVKLDKKRGVRDSYVLTAQSDVAEVNPVLRHALAELYDLRLPERVDLTKTDTQTFHQVLAAEIARSEPGITLHYLLQPQIKLIHQRAKRRLRAWRSKSRATGRGVRQFGDITYSYSQSNFHPLGRQLFLQKVKPHEDALEAHLEHAVQLSMAIEIDPGTDQAESVVETERSAYALTERATGPYDWAVDLSHQTLGNFNDRKMSLVRDYTRILDADDHDEHPAFDALFSLDARALDAPPEDGAGPLDSFLVVPADPTQAAAVAWARSGRDFIIQGPPGTGKSQTITNLIADFAARGQRVLFVCQKRAALDVVFHRLAQHGLDELAVIIHDSQADKRPFLKELGETYARWLKPAADEGKPPEVARKAATQSIETPLKALDAFSTAMAGPAHGAEAPVVEVARARLAAGEAPELSAEQAELVPARAPWRADRATVHALGEALAERDAPPVLAECPLRYVGAEVLRADRPVAALRAGLSRLRSLLEPAAAAATAVKAGASLGELAAALALARAARPIHAAGRLELLDASSASTRELATQLSVQQGLSRQLANARAATGNWIEKLDPADLKVALVQARAFAKMFVLFRVFMPSWWRLRRVLNSRYDFSRHAVAPPWTTPLEGLAAEYDRAEALAEAEVDIRTQYGFDGDLNDFAQALERLRDDEAWTPFQRELRARWRHDGSPIDALLGSAAAIEGLAAATRAVFDDADALTIDALAELVEASEAAAEDLPDLQGPLLAFAETAPEVRRGVRALPLTPAAMDVAVDAETLTRTFRAQRSLAKFDRKALAKRAGTIDERYDSWLAANAQVIRHRVRARFFERVSLGERAPGSLKPEQKALVKAYKAGRRLLEKEFKKVMRHRSIRELSSGDSGVVLYDLKPIWLMSPLSISDTIPLADARFDVVIFDEASQIPLEEAVPAVHRSPQMIVVGDEMQLPPTNFFAAKREEGEPEVDPAHYDLDADSFLSHAAQKLPSTMLGWHYRSRSESLIRFSNQAFYDGDLMTVPDRGLRAERAPIRVEAPYDGAAAAAALLGRDISSHRLEDGLYAKRRNAPEARYIAELVRGLFDSGSQLTLGIVAFSEAQQGEIEQHLTALGREDRAFAQALEAEYEREEDGQLVGLFVKNLENVQGDERDIIILSVCYGHDAAGKMRMNFGPINKGGGEKRLNVVFSRAKRHMAVVSSIDYTAITNEYNQGANCFRRYLQYAEAVSCGDAVGADTVMRALGASPQAVGEAPVGPVVAQLAEALAARGHETRPNVGSSEYRVDLAVRAAGEEAFSVAVLVDTPAHYANPDLFERYHQRPSVLRAFGWRVVWVLTKDWLSDREGCVKAVEKALSTA